MAFHLPRDWRNMTIANLSKDIDLRLEHNKRHLAGDAFFH